MDAPRQLSLKVETDNQAHFSALGFINSMVGSGGRRSQVGGERRIK